MFFLLSILNRAMRYTTRATRKQIAITAVIIFAVVMILQHTIYHP